MKFHWKERNLLLKEDFNKLITAQNTLGNIVYSDPPQGMCECDEKGNIIADYKPVDLKIDFDDRQKVIDSIKLFIDFFHIKPEELKNKDED